MSIRNIVLSLIVFPLFLQSYDVGAQTRATLDYELTAEGALSTGDYTPYMLTVNRHDLLAPRANTGYLSAGIKGDYQLNEQVSFKGGLTALASVHSNHRFYLQELYLQATYRKIYIEIGARQQSSPVINEVLSSGDLIYSGNAKPIPSVHGATIGFVTLPYTQGWIESYADFGYGKLLDDDWTKERFAEYHAAHNGSFFTTDVTFHHKELYLRSNSQKRFFATIGMQHSVFFGGIKQSYESGKEVISGKKATLKDYFKVLIPKSDGSASNAGDSFVYGNHLGVWYADLGYHLSSNQLLKAYMEKPFEDGSGIAFRNGFDGLWGLEYSVSDVEGVVPVRGVVLEYVQTTNQSGPIHWAPGDFNSSVSGQLPSEATGADNYYNNFYYNGYSQYGLSIGSALLKSPYYNEDSFLNYTDNRVQAWHLGVNGDVSEHFDYLVKCSYREGFGTSFIPLKQKHHSFDALTQLRWHKGSWQCSVSYALTKGNVYGDASGFDFKITYHGKLF